MEKKIISGIQQIGIGVRNVMEAWSWYKDNFGTDVRVFEDDAVAELMLPYTGGKPQKRHAALALNMQGGGGFEIWQYKGRTPKEPEFQVKLGDYGIFAAKIKSKNVEKTYEKFVKANNNLPAGLSKDPLGEPIFYVYDPYGNLFQVVGGNSWYKNENKLTGGAYGAIIGVSDIEQSRKLYSEILEYDKVIYDIEDTFEDFSTLPGGKSKFRRVLLSPGKPREGGFSNLFGTSTIELIEARDRDPNKIYHDRYWGDLGFIHLCYDIHGMEVLKEECREKGFGFTVDSDVNHNDKNSFDMGEAAGHFSYIEDPDGTLIEFVETHKIPIIKKLGLYLNLRKRDPRKPVPNWLLKALSFNKVKF